MCPDRGGESGSGGGTDGSSGAGNVNHFGGCDGSRGGEGGGAVAESNRYTLERDVRSAKVGEVGRE